MKLKKIKSLHISAQRWFHKTYGNTYHSVTVFVNGETLRADFVYGYGEQFFQTAQALLEKAGYDMLLRTDTENLNSFYSHYLNSWQLREVLKGTYSVADVQRKKDL